MSVKKSFVATASLGLLGMAAVSAQPAGVPAATAVAGTTTMCAAEGVEYSGRWSIPNNGIDEADLESCAAACEADAECTGATWIDWEDDRDVPNCYFKAWDPAAAAVPCQLSNNPPGRVYAAIITLNAADCDSIVYMDDPSIDCITEKETFGEFSGSLPALAPAAEIPAVIEEEAIGPAPVAPVTPPAVPIAPPAAPNPILTALESMDPPYKGYVGYDYSPNQVPAPMVMVENLVLGGATYETVINCAENCDLLPGCNAASWYGDNPIGTWPAGNNCWLKSIGVPCVLPADAEVTELPDTILIMVQEDCTAVPPALIAPMVAPVAPVEVPLTPMDGPTTVLAEGPAIMMAPAAGPSETRDFDTGFGLLPTAPAGPPTPTDPIVVPQLTTDTDGPAPGPADAGIGINDPIGGLGSSGAAAPATSISPEAGGAPGLSAAVTVIAAVAAAVCLLL